MPPVDRNQPKRAASSESSYSLMEFMREFPDDAACMEHLWRSRFAPDEAMFRLLLGRAAMTS